jgi:hypothetical protein
VTSIFQRALGEDFGRLHPHMRRRFGFASHDGIACIGVGVMDEIWRGPAFTVPFLHVGSTRNILFPERAHDVPFTIGNYAYRDAFGRETLTFARAFDLPGGRQRRFDATMIYSSARGRIIDYLGTHQHLAVDLEVSVDATGGLRIRSGAQRFYEGPFSFRFPATLTGTAEVHEWYDDHVGCFRINVTVSNRRFGALFGYRGKFQARYPRLEPQDFPPSVRPVRESVRD